ncbi:metalloprotease family M48X [Achlya hypogyna]|uniref:Metalloprotease family M48X n=1 Tax=Achlya hypogyna TaxID=1202772 RepID=A0A1V9Z721_ACHHY|nr:metalloprotease family M48X [Achlya hypogyna]
MLSRIVRSTIARVPKRRAYGNYSVRVVQPRDVTFYQAQVEAPLHARLVMTGCWSLIGLGSVAAAYQFLTNLHTVPISGRTQVVVFSNEEIIVSPPLTRLGDDLVQAMGNEHAEAAIKGATIITDGPRYRMVKDVASRLVVVAEKIFQTNYKWKVFLVDDPQVNACCFSGGIIFVYTGLLNAIDQFVADGHCKNKYNALATVVGHEIGHAVAKHTPETMSFLPLLIIVGLFGLDNNFIPTLFEYVCNLPFSRMHETEADHIGLMLMAAACYDPSEAASVWRGMKALKGEDGDILEFLSTHPADERREANLMGWVEEAVAYQASASWCKDIQDRVSNIIYKRVRQRQATVNTTHAAEMKAVLDGLQAASK